MGRAPPVTETELLLRFELLTEYRLFEDAGFFFITPSFKTKVSLNTISEYRR